MPSSITITRGRLTATISALGAQLMSLELDGREYLWQGDRRWWGKRAPILFPIVGSLRADHALSRSGPVSLGRHGFARDLEHHLAGTSDDGRSVTFELCDTSETRKLFPYAFRLRTSYALTGPASLTQTFSVTNTGSVTLPFSVGGHPAFNVPVPSAAGERFEDFKLEFSRAWSARSPVIAEGGLLSCERERAVLDDADALPLTHELFASDAIMLTDVPDRVLRLRSARSGHGISIEFPDFRHIGIWSAAGEAPFVALEPWTGHATLTCEDDVFEHKRDIIELPAGHTDERSFTVGLF
ncbi:Aldose 1-epimerase [Coriobacterium glomerans PW2]|uniref:Aldose 1-epimerase n=1 Tax=Coriobacterium glomerans (strain ATCC 49209 / DSM 20642 / JCM 10262 / PW2) TaxID=700015 RepID=F2N9Z8_CORGP|nr:aldose 1-epimerase family protein [Coriobacterium glomerans]AEB06253.1 Aldose 1-epimerase [Coriobacterium glomerans PW2]